METKVKLTAAEIDAMQAGRELDALIARHVLGFVWDESCCRVCGWPIEPEHCQIGNCSLRPAPARRADEAAPYSTDIAAAWEVKAYMAASGKWSFVFNIENSGYCAANFYRGKDEEHIAVGWSKDEEPAVICRAALRAVMNVA